MAGKDSLSAVILASGRATRLKEECACVPKCLLVFNGVPFLDYLINWVFSAGVRKIIITACTHKQKIEEEIASTWAGFPVEVACEEELKNTVTSALAGLRLVDTSDALLLTADSIWEMSLRGMIDFHQHRAADATILATVRDSVPNLGFLKTLNTGQVVSIKGLPAERASGKGLTSASTMGVYIVNVPKIIESIDLANDSGIEIEPLARLLPNVWAYWCEGLFFDYGTPEKLTNLRQNPALIEQHFGRLN